MKRIGLLGLGTVGQGVVQLLDGSDAFAITHVLVRDPKKQRSVDLSQIEVTTDAESIITHPDVDIIIEVMGGLEPAYDYILRSLSHGKDVITANKAVIAQYGDKIIARAREYDRKVRFEAAVGGAVPIIQHLLQKQNVRELTMIINGTTNYILTQMANGGSYEEALRAAQDNGFAEADPSADVDGDDAAQKLAIATSLSTGAWVDWKHVHKEGITRLQQKDLALAAELGYSVKLLACYRSGEQLDLRVHPALIPSESQLCVDNEYNAVHCVTQSSDGYLVGKGAGQLPTASAVASDVHTLDFDMDVYPQKMNDMPVAALSQKEFEYYLRVTGFSNIDEPPVLVRDVDHVYRVTRKEEDMRQLLEELINQGANVAAIKIIEC